MPRCDLIHPVSYRFYFLLPVKLVVALFLFSHAVTQAGADTISVSLSGTAAAGQYLSGTNCRINGIAQANMPNAYITTAILSVGGYTVKTYNFSDDNTPSAGKNLQSVFASTYFQNGNSVQEKYEAWDNLGNYNMATHTLTAYNVATIYGRNDFESVSSGTGPANSNLSGMHHDVSRTVTFKGWSAGRILSDIVPCTAFYVNSHGSPTPTFTSDLDELTGSMQYVYPWEALDPNHADQVLEQRWTSEATSIPPVNVAFLDCCVTGGTNDFANAFLYPFQAYQTAIDQAELGWNISVEVDFTNTSSSTFWTNLAQGYTAQQARDLVERAYLDYKHLADYPSGLHRGDYLRCWGDYNTTLQGAYTGGVMPQGVSRNWYY